MVTEKGVTSFWEKPVGNVRDENCRLNFKYKDLKMDGFSVFVLSGSLQVRNPRSRAER